MPLLASVRIRELCAIAALLVAQSGCAAHRTSSADLPATVPVVFANESSEQTEVWVIAPNVNTRRVGAVMAGETTTLQVPAEFYRQGTISFYTRMRTSSGGPGIYDVLVHENETLRLRLPRSARNLERIGS